MDDDAGDLAIERAPDRVADRRVHLAGDLRDGDPESDRQVELELDAIVEADREAGLPEAESRDEA